MANPPTTCANCGHERYAHPAWRDFDGSCIAFSPSFEPQDRVCPCKAFQVAAESARQIRAEATARGDAASLSPAPAEFSLAEPGCACGHTCDHGPHEHDLDHEPEQT